jgi:amino acid permease
MRTRCFLLSLLFFASFAHLTESSISKPKKLTTLLVNRGGGGKTRPAPVSLQKNDPLPVGTASMSSEVFNLIKSIVGAGVLGLPAGIAAVGHANCALTPALILLTAVGIASGYGFYLIALVCQSTSSTTYRQAWRRTVGKASFLPATACLLVTACSVLTYSMILADTLPDIAKALFGLTVTRTSALLGVTVALLPLCMMRELSKLAPFSLMGIMGVTYTSLAMTARWWRGDYLLPGGNLISKLPDHHIPRFGSSCFSSNAAVLVAMLSTAFMAHYNAPKLYWELRDNTLARFGRVTSISFAAASLLMGITAAAGFLTFGMASQSVILANYAVNDNLMSASRIAVALSLFFSYPLAFLGVRQGVIDLFEIKGDKWFTPLTVLCLAVVTGLALVVKDIGIILALGGATWGNAVIYLFPSLMLWNAAKTNKALQAHVTPAVATGVIGLFMGTVATYRALTK